MNKLTTIITMIVISLASFVYAQDAKVIEHLQDVTVFINTDNGSGTGVLFTRDILKTKDSKEKVQVTFVLTAAHVLGGAKITKTVYDEYGTAMTFISYGDIKVIKEIYYDSVKISTIAAPARILYEDQVNDIAILMLSEAQSIDISVNFYNELQTPSICTRLIHVGCLQGSSGMNSFTDGIISKLGRILKIKGIPQSFDQVSCTIYPGSSGGGVFLEDGRYVGMATRSAGPTFSYMIPIRRINYLMKKANMRWVMDKSAPMPVLEDLKKRLK